MGFMNSMKEVLDEDYNVSITENGAVGYRTSGKNLLDLNFATASLRKASDDNIADKFEKAFYEDKLYSLKWLFYCRDVREGLGERRTPRVILKYLAENEKDIANALIPLVAEYGRYDDLLVFIGTPCENTALALMKKQFTDDVAAMKAKKPITLLAKWLPSENASSKKTKENAKIVRSYFGLTPRKYRKTLSKLRAYLNVVEVKMSAKEWGKIDYEAVPSKANLLYNSAFLRNDEDRRRAYLGALQKGEVKINSSVNFPHDIVHKYDAGRYGKGKTEDAALEAMWKALPDMVGENGNTLVVRDGSGSMEDRVDPHSNVTALDVATALAIYFSERCSGEFKDKYITFSANPKLVDLSGYPSLYKKLKRSYQEAECMNTNIEKTFDLILETAVKNHMSQDEMPKNILIISDDEFDSMTCQYNGYYGRTSSWTKPDEKLFQTIAKKFKAQGYLMPRLVFWNVNSRTGTIPVKQNKLGVALVSGFSVNVCKMVLSGELDPYKCLIEQLDTERYKPVEEAVKTLI